MNHLTDPDIPPPPNAPTAPYGTLAWWQQRFLAENQRLMGRYCCTDAAEHGKQSCSRHGRADAAEILAAHGLSAAGLSPVGQRITTADAARYLV